MRELDELEANNTKRIVFGLVALVGVAVGIGLLFRSKGTGEPEQDHRILIVEDNTVGFEYYTADLGFEPISGSFEAWQEELAEQDGKRAAEEFGLEDLLEFADLHGYGYVVIEHPQRFSDAIAQLELSEDGASSIGETEFAVFSVGDFANPFVLGVDPPAPSVELDVGRRMLRTMFAHPRLGQTLDEGAAPSDIQAARLKLDKAIKNVEQIATHEKRAAEVMSALVTELGGFVSQQDGARKARVLHEPLAGGNAYALTDGRVLVRSDALEFVVEDAGLDYDSTSEYSLRVIPAGVPASADAGVDCPELLGGDRGRYTLSRMELSVERDAMFVLHRGDVGTLLVFDAAAGPCGLREVAKLPLPSTENTYVAVNRRGIAMRHIDDDNELHIDVQAAGAEPIAIAKPEMDTSSSLVWLDDRRLANLVNITDGYSSHLLLVDLDRADAPLLLTLQPPDVSEFWADELARVPGSDRTLLVRWSVGETYYLHRLDFDRPWAEVIGEVPPNITWTLVSQIDAHVRGFDIDPAGRAVAFTVEGNDGVDVVVAPLPAAGAQAGERVVILDDAHEHREVSFRPKHDEILFRTRIEIEKPKASLLSVHAIDVTMPN